MNDVIMNPANPLTCIRRAATKLLHAYKVCQLESDGEIKAETLCLEAIELTQLAVKSLRKDKKR